MTRLAKLAIVALAAREIAALYGRFDPDTLTVQERVSRLEEALPKIEQSDVDLFVLNAPRRLTAIETLAEGTAASHATLARTVATLEDRVDEVARRGAPDPEDVTT